MTAVLVLSPHPDDVAWSLGATVLALRPAPVHVLTFFTRTTYAPGHPGHGDEHAATAVRAAEERAWAERAGVRLHRADLPDCSLRGYDDDTELGPPPEPAAVAAVRAELDRVLVAVRPVLVLVPLAAAGHVDHAAVRAAAADLPDPVWYEDLPYAATPGAVAAAVPPGGEPVPVPGGDRWPEVEAGVRCFPSQRPDELLPLLRARAGDRLWAGPTTAARLHRTLS